MQLLRSADVAPSPREQVFRHSTARALGAAVVLAAADVTLVVLAPQDARGWICDWIAFVLLVVFLATVRLVFVRRRPSNWLVRLRDDGLYVQIRSHLNAHLPAGDPTVLFVPFAELVSARLVRERVTVETQREITEQRRRLVELEVSADTAAAAEAIAAEIARRPPAGGVRTIYRHYPVQVTSPTTIRIEWGVVPRAEVLLDALRRHVAVGEPLDVAGDCTRFETKSPEAQDVALRKLVATGQTIAAIEMVRRARRCGLADARAVVDGLAGR